MENNHVKIRKETLSTDHSASVLLLVSSLISFQLCKERVQQPPPRLCSQDLASSPRCFSIFQQIARQSKISTISGAINTLRSEVEKQPVLSQ